MRIRNTVRLVLIDAENRVLLIKIKDKLPIDPNLSDNKNCWITPGGGVEADETFEQGLIREAWEEIGLTLEDTGQCVWVEEPISHFPDETVCFNTRYHFVRIQKHTVKMMQLTELEQDVFVEFRWWTLKELQETKEVLM